MIVSCRLSVCLCVTRAECEQTAERIDVLFGAETPAGPRNIVLDREGDGMGSMQPSPDYFGHLFVERSTELRSIISHIRTPLPQQDQLLYDVITPFWT